MNLKQQALLTMAEAFLARGANIQYDQRSMDRVLELTPRRRKRLPPEAATDQYTLFLDCSGYASALYLQAFDYELPSDLTWIMVDRLPCRKYYRENTHTETEEEKTALWAGIKAMLEPGDLIVYDRGVGSGHITIWLGDGRFTDCAFPTGCRDSYDYLYRRNNYYPEGGLYLRDGDTLGQWLFGPRVRRMAVCRPMELPLEITPATRARMTTAKGLYCALESSAPGLVPVCPGGTVTYTLTVENRGEAETPVWGSFEAPAGTALMGDGTVSGTLAPGGSLRLDFAVTVDAGFAGLMLEGPRVSVNNLPVYGHPVLLGRACPDGVQAAIEAGIRSGRTALEAAAEVWAGQGVRLEPDGAKCICSLFCYHDSTRGEALSRRPQKPFSDLAVWSAFGGRGVITPEMAGGHGMRLTRITEGDLLPGDILLTARDAFGEGAESRLWDGRQFVGSDPEQSHTRLESLFGRFVWVLLRPSQGL